MNFLAYMHELWYFKCLHMSVHRHATNNALPHFKDLKKLAIEHIGVKGYVFTCNPVRLLLFHLCPSAHLSWCPSVLTFFRLPIFQFFHLFLVHSDVYTSAHPSTHPLACPSMCTLPSTYPWSLASILQSSYHMTSHPCVLGPFNRRSGPHFSQSICGLHNILAFVHSVSPALYFWQGTSLSYVLRVCPACQARTDVFSGLGIFLGLFVWMSFSAQDGGVASGTTYFVLQRL